jgi:Xaa-Pro dipeptidase
MTNSLDARGAVIDIPDEPDRARMRSETGARLKSAMADHGVDALILLMNGYVGYATGASWPLLDAGLSHVERPVAVVLADDEYPHLFMPLRSGAAAAAPVPDDHLHGPAYLEFDRGVDHFAGELAELIPPGAHIAVDELTGAMRRAAPRLFSSGAPSDAAIVVGDAQLVKTRDELSCLRRASRITEQAVADVQQALAPGVRQIDLSATLVRRAFELGATTNMLEAIWQVMPSSREAGVWTTHGDLALPLLPTERELAAGDVLWTDISITYAGYCSDFGRTWLVGEQPTPRQQDQFHQWRAILDAVLAVTRGDCRQRWAQTLAAALLSRPRHRHLPGRGAHDRHRSRRGIRRQLRLSARDGPGSGTGDLGRRDGRLSQ